jgi:pyocin large subunit-like protein
MFLATLLLLAAGPGFRSRRAFDEHYAKHGREFGNVSQGEYLRMAQDLRDAPAGGPILQALKPGGVITRFDRRTSAFGAYNADGTIRTFFIPVDGERYFRRQATRPND